MGSLIDANRRVQIPGFCKHSRNMWNITFDTGLYADDKVRSQTKEEERLYDMLSEITQRPAALLSSRWTVPSLTIHNIESTGPKSWFIYIKFQ